MKVLHYLFENNRRWAAEMTSDDPDFFLKLSKQQKPKFLWIGCSDSRVPANQVVGLLPGEMFVHRNVANVVVPSDLNCLSTLQFAVDVLRVEHVIVCGHYGCGGLLAALRGEQMGLVDNWLCHVQDIYAKHRSRIEQLKDESMKYDLFCRLNVIEQVANVSRTTIVRNAWARGQTLTVHGWIYSISDGLLHDLQMCVLDESELPGCYEKACQQISVP